MHNFGSTHSSDNLLDGLVTNLLVNSQDMEIGQLKFQWNLDTLVIRTKRSELTPFCESYKKQGRKKFRGRGGGIEGGRVRVVRYAFFTIKMHV